MYLQCMCIGLFALTEFLFQSFSQDGMASEHYLLSVCREQALKAFKAGRISLEERAGIDAACDATLQRIREAASAADAQLPDDVQLICKPAVATYHVNFSG